jgi:hypothetical protein
MNIRRGLNSLAISLATLSPPAEEEPTFTVIPDRRAVKLTASTPTLKKP